MANWLVRASGALSRDTEEAPQEFLLTCECGQVHRGHRRSRPQRIVCQTCGTALFVLPRNPYPILKPQVRKRKRRRGSSGRSGELPSLVTFTRAVGRGAAAVGWAFGEAAAGAGRAVTDWAVSRAASLARLMRSQMTPFRSVLAAIILLLLGTALWTVHRSTLEQARMTLRDQLDAGQTALAADDPARAHEHFVRAAAAAQTLHSDDLRSRHARQMLHETLALTRLAPVSLLEILEEAERTASSEHPEIWEDRFRGTYAGTWVVLDAPIHAATDPADGTLVTIDLPLVVGAAGRPVSVTAAVPDEARSAIPSQPQRAIFAAALADCRLEAAGRRWQVTLRSETGFLWADVDNLRRLGYFESEWISEEETAQLLEVQSRALGLR